MDVLIYLLAMQQSHSEYGHLAQNMKGSNMKGSNTLWDIIFTHDLVSYDICPTCKKPTLCSRVNIPNPIYKNKYKKEIAIDISAENLKQLPPYEHLHNAELEYIISAFIKNYDKYYNLCLIPNYKFCSHCCSVYTGILREVYKCAGIPYYYKTHLGTKEK